MGGWRAVISLMLAVACLVWITPGGAAQRRADVSTWSSPAPIARPTPLALHAEGPGVLVVDLLDGSDADDLAAVSEVVGAPLRWLHPLAVDEALAIAEVEDLAAAIAALAQHPLVEAAEPEVTLRLSAWPDDPLYPKQWHLPAMGAPEGWRATPRGRGVVVAVVDTGVAAVDDLVGSRLLEGASFVPGADTPHDDHGHGTHVAGTIAQATHNGLGAAGVAPEVQILPIKVLSRSGAGTNAQVAAGIDHAVDLGAQVINLSLGSSEASAVVAIAVRKARAKGVVVVAAAGNQGLSRAGWPAAMPECIGVAAVGPGGLLAPYSNRGEGVDLAAPGGDLRKQGGGVLQQTLTGGAASYRALQGTSMAAPHVSGAVAVALSTGLVDGPGAERLILAGARTNGAPAGVGRGLLDLGASLELVGLRGSGRRALFGGLAAWIIAGLSLRGLGFRVVAAVCGAWAAGGLFFVVPSSWSMGLLSRSPLDAALVLFGPGLGHGVVWALAPLPIALAVVLGLSRPAQAAVVGLSAGLGVHLALGAAKGSWAAWWVPGVVASSWFGLSSALALVGALAVAGVARARPS